MYIITAMDIGSMTPEGSFFFGTEQLVRILDHIGGSDFTPPEDRVLVLGIKEQAEGVDRPPTDIDRFNKPGKGLMLAIHRNLRNTDAGKTLGAYCHFDKYQATELIKNGRKFYSVNVDKIEMLERLDPKTTFASILASSY